MARWLAARVTASGSVLPTDIDVSGRAGPVPVNVTVARHDLERDETPAGRAHRLARAETPATRYEPPGS